MKWLYLMLLFTGLVSKTVAQTSCQLHIVTTYDNRQSLFKLEFTVNRAQFKLMPGHCLELRVQADSIHILMKDTRWVKKEPVDLHVKSDKDLYVHLFWGHWKTESRNKIRAFTEVVCKECFDELKKKCRKTVME